MTDVNKVMVLGNVGREPEIRYTPNGSANCELSVAANHNYKKGDDWQKETEWFTVVCWNKTAEHVSQNVSKGDRVYVEGRLKTRSWEDKEGNKRYKTELIADRVLLQGSGTSKVREDVAAGGDDLTDPEDLPF